MSPGALESEWELDSGSEQGKIASSPLPHAKAGTAMERGEKEKRVSHPEDCVSHLKNRQLPFNSKSRWPLGTSNNARLLT